MWKNQYSNRSDRDNSRRSRSPRRERRTFGRRTQSPRNDVASKRKTYRDSPSPIRKEGLSHNRSPKRNNLNDRYFHKEESYNAVKTSTDEFSTRPNDLSNQNYHAPQHKVENVSDYDIGRKGERNTTSLQHKHTPLGPQHHKTISTGKARLISPMSNSLSAGCKFLSGRNPTGMLTNEPVIPAPKIIVDPKLADNLKKNVYSSKHNTNLDKVKKHEKEKYYDNFVVDEKRSGLDNNKFVARKPTKESRTPRKVSRISSSSAELHLHEDKSKKQDRMKYVEHELKLNRSISASFQDDQHKGNMRAMTSPSLHEKRPLALPEQKSPIFGTPSSKYDWRNSESFNENRNMFEHEKNFFDSTNRGNDHDDYHHRNDFRKPTSDLQGRLSSPNLNEIKHLQSMENSSDYLPAYLKNYDSGPIMFKGASDYTSMTSTLFPTPYINKQENADDDLPCYSWVGELLDDENKSNDDGINGKNEKKIPTEKVSLPDKRKSSSGNRRSSSKWDSYDTLKDTYSSARDFRYDCKSYSMEDDEMVNDYNRRKVDSIHPDQEYHVSKKVLEAYDNVTEMNLRASTKKDREVKSISVGKPKKSILKKSGTKMSPLTEGNNIKTGESTNSSNKTNTIKITNKQVATKEKHQFSKNEDSLSAELRENVGKVSEQSTNAEEHHRKSMPYSSNTIQYTEKMSKYASGWKKAMSENFPEKKEIVKEKKTSENNRLEEIHHNSELISQRKVVKREIPDKREVEFQEKVLIPQSRTFLDRDVEKSLHQNLPENTRVVVPISRPTTEAKKEDRNTWDSLIELQEHVYGTNHANTGSQKSGFAFWGKPYVEWFSKNVLPTPQFQNFVKTSSAFKGMSDLTEIPILFLRSLSEGDKLAKRCIPKNAKDAKELLQYVGKFRAIKKDIQGLCNELGLEKNASGKILLPNQDKITPRPKPLLEAKKSEDRKRPKVVKINREKFQPSPSKQAKVSPPIQSDSKSTPIPVLISGGMILPKNTSENKGQAIPTIETGNLQITRTVNQNDGEQISTIVSQRSVGDISPKVGKKFKNFNLTQSFVIDNTDAKTGDCSSEDFEKRNMDELFDEMEDKLRPNIVERSSTPPRKVIVMSRSRSPKYDPSISKSISKGSRSNSKDQRTASNTRSGPNISSSLGEISTSTSQSSTSIEIGLTSRSISSRHPLQSGVITQENGQRRYDRIRISQQGLSRNQRLKKDVNESKNDFYLTKRDSDKVETLSTKKQRLSTSSKTYLKDETKDLSEKKQKDEIISRTVQNNLAVPSSSPKNEDRPQSKSKSSANQQKTGVRWTSNNKTVGKNFSKNTSEKDYKKVEIKPITFDEKKGEYLKQLDEKGGVFGAKKKVFISERKFKHPVYFTGALKTKAREFKSYIKDILAQNPLNYLYDIDLYDAGAIEHVLEKFLRFNEKFQGQDYTKHHAFFLMRQLFQDVEIRSTMQDDIIQMIESRGDTWKLINWNTFTDFQKQTFGTIKSSSSSPNGTFMRYREKEIEGITRKLDMLFPQYHGDAFYFIKMWSWTNEAKRILRSLGIGTCKGLPPLEKISQNEAGKNNLQSWLSKVYNCPPYETSRTKNSAILSAIICQGVNLSPDWILTSISDWWSKGYYISRYKEVEDGDEKRNEETDFNMEGMVIIDEDFCDGDDSVRAPEDTDMLENLNHEMEYSEDRSGAPTIFLY